MSTLGSISCRELERALKKLGFRFDRQNGSHKAYTKRGIASPIIVPRHRTGQDVPMYIIRQIAKTCGVSKEELVELAKSQSIIAQ